MCVREVTVYPCAGHRRGSGVTFEPQKRAGGSQREAERSGPQSFLSTDVPSGIDGMSRAAVVGHVPPRIIPIKK